MNAPLAQFLKRFPGADDSIAVPAPVAIEARVSLSAADLESHLAAAREAGRLAADAAHATTVESLVAAYEAERVQALAAAQADWEAMQASSIVTHIDAAFATLQSMLSDEIAGVLRPLLSKALSERTRDVLLDAIDRVLADPDHPALAIRGPRGLLDAVRAARPAATGLVFEVADVCDATVTGATIHIETRLGSALADLAGLES